MEEFIRRLTELLGQHFTLGEVELEIAGPRRVGGLLVWDGFVGREQIERQRTVWRVLREHLTPEEQLQVSAILTLTPEEMTAARAG